VTLAGKGQGSPYLRAWDVWRVIARFRPDVVHTHGLQAMVNVGPIAACRLAPRWIHTFHYGNYPYASRRHMFLERLFSSLADQLVAVAEPQREALIRHHGFAPDHVMTVTNGVPANPFEHESDVTRRKREELGIPPEAPLIGTIAVLSEQKGIPYFIEAAQEVLRVMPSAKFVVVGSGSLADSLTAHVAALGLGSSILFTGWRSDVAELLMALDVWVMSSLWEAMPLALLEAMAAARAIVATDVSDNRRILHDGNAGVLVPPRDAAALARAILGLVREPEQARNLGRRARAVFGEHYTVSRMVSHYERLYENGASEAPTRTGQKSAAA
jgi:glycosyltransferase involved in cell wall biosynthesis